MVINVKCGKDCFETIEGANPTEITSHDYIADICVGGSAGKQVYSSECRVNLLFRPDNQLNTKASAVFNTVVYDAVLGICCAMTAFIWLKMGTSGGLL
jgi:hypothetical protein